MEFRKMVTMTYMQDSKSDTDIKTFEPCGRKRGWDDVRE